MTYTPEHVHLVGSIGLPSVADVFHTCGTLLGRRLQRIPDGEPGGRRLWGVGVASADAAAIASLRSAGFAVRLVQADNGLLDVELMPGRRAGAEELAALVQVAAQLRTLNLRNAGISDAKLASIGSLPQL